MRAGAGEREAGEVEDHRRGGLGQHRADQGSRLRILEAGDVERQRVEAGVPAGGDQGVDRGEVGGLDQSAVEHDGGGGALRSPVALELAEVGLGGARPVEAGMEQGRGLAPGLAAPEQGRGIGEQLLGIGEAALDAVAPKPLAGVLRQGAPAGQLGIGPVIAGQAGQLNAARPAGAGDLLDAVAPIGAAAKQAEDDQAGVAQHALDIEIDRERMGEAQEIGEAERGRVGGAVGLGLGQAGQLGVGGREIEDVARALAEIDGLAVVVGGDLAGV